MLFRSPAGTEDARGAGMAMREVEAFAYAVIARDGEHVAPSREYVEALLDGARERGLPDNYVASLASLAASG